MTRCLKLHFTDGELARQERKRLGLNQLDFWSPVGITQSGGSRYEKGGRDIPMPVQLLLEIAYGTEKQVAAAIEHLRGVAKP